MIIPKGVGIGRGSLEGVQTFNFKNTNYLVNNTFF